jgi:hypothetical protein
MNAKLAAFAKQEQSEDMIQIGIGQKHRRERAIPRALRRRMQAGKRLHLRAKVRRRVDQKPFLSVGAEGNTRLSAGRNDAGACGLTIETGTIPLRNTSAGSGSQEANANTNPRNRMTYAVAE